MDRKQLLDFAVKAGKGIFEEQGHLTSTIIAHSQSEGLMIIGCPWRNEAEKQALLSILRVSFKKKNVSAYALSSEVWYLSLSDEEAEEHRRTGLMVSEIDRRREALNFLAVDHDGVDTASFDIERPADGPAYLSERSGISEFEAVEGRMTTLLSDEVSILDELRAATLGGLEPADETVN